MELLYLYIEDDGKNIKDCEFNFSPKYRFHYDKQTNTLTKEDLPDYIPNFWGAKNVSNITAIIGENGAGKSNLIEFISLALCGGLKGDNNGLVVWKYDNAIFSNKKVNNSFSLIESVYPEHPYPLMKLDGDKGIKDTLLMYYSTHIDKVNPTDSDKGHFTDISTASLIRLSKPEKQIEGHQYLFSDIQYSQIADTFRQLLFFRNFDDKYLPPNITIPEYLDIIIHYPKDVKIPGLYQGLYDKLLGLIEKKEPFQKELGKVLLRQFFSPDMPSWAKDKTLIKVLRLTPIFLFYIETKKLFKQGKIKYKSRGKLVGSNANTWNDFKFSINRKAIKEKEISALIGFYSQDPSYHHPTFSCIERNKFNCNQYNTINWQGASSGELAVFTLLSRIFSNLRFWQGEMFDGHEQKAYPQEEYKYKNIILVLDEPDTSLHPEWQRRFLNILIVALKEAFSSFNFQIIITSHSPIIVSDFPNNNIIFLSRTKEGNCFVKNSIDIGNTFGANIHALYRNSFFLKGMPIGEFAKEKIEKLFKELRGKNSFTRAELAKTKKQIQMIGEPLLKNELMKLYNEKCNIEERISELEKEIAELKRQNR